LKRPPAVTIASIQFLVFAAVAASLYNLGTAVWWRQAILTAANVSFLATFSLGAASYLPFVCFVVFGYAATRTLEQPGGKRFFIPALVAVIGLFFWLKRYSFIPSALLMSQVYVTIGLSYLFFRMLHVLIDTRDGALEGPIGPIAYFNYLTNFPSLVSGPIQFYQDYAATQLASQRPTLDWIIAGGAVERVIVGFFNVVVAAPIFMTMHERALAVMSTAQPFDGRVSTVFTVVVSYTLFLYCNFSGYTDIVIGVGRFLRLDLPENFNRPFSAVNFIDFWARWHMTLSNWLKIYVYIPLLKALMQRYPAPAVEPFLGIIAFFVTFFLIGLWHGQTSIFAVYGLVLGLGVSGNKLYQITMARILGRKRHRALNAQPIYQALARGLTFTYFTLTLVCFWGNWEIIRAMVALLGSSGLAALTASMVLVAGVALAVAEFGHRRILGLRLGNHAIFRSRYVRTVWGTALATVTAAALVLLATPAPDVVYKTF
jgi:alginate O-acetyltransferase complex protein AlgI